MGNAHGPYQDEELSQDHTNADHPARGAPPRSSAEEARPGHGPGEQGADLAVLPAVTAYRPLNS